MSYDVPRPVPDDFFDFARKFGKPIDDLARIWAYTGLQTSDRHPKPALAVWDNYLKATHVRP